MSVTNKFRTGTNPIITNTPDDLGGFFMPKENPVDFDQLCENFDFIGPSTTLP